MITGLYAFAIISHVTSTRKVISKTVPVSQQCGISTDQDESTVDRSISLQYDTQYGNLEYNKDAVSAIDTFLDIFLNSDYRVIIKNSDSWKENLDKTLADTFTINRNAISKSQFEDNTADAISKGEAEANASFIPESEIEYEGNIYENGILKISFYSGDITYFREIFGMNKLTCKNDYSIPVCFCLKNKTPDKEKNTYTIAGFVTQKVSADQISEIF